jgi:hypothetical protein
MHDSQTEVRVLLRSSSLRAPWAKLLRIHRGELLVTQSGADIAVSIDGVNVPQSAAVCVRVQRRLLCATLHLTLPDARRFEVRGLKTKFAYALAHFLSGFAIATEVTGALRSFSEAEPDARYMGFAAFDQWCREARPLRQRLLPSEPRVALPVTLPEEVGRLARIVDVGEAARLERNERFVAQELRRFGATLGKSAGYSLNDEQLKAVLHDEDRALVVAGAGTGKTSTIVGKVEYLLAAGLCKPDKILLMAFTKKAAEEMRERVVRVTGASVAVKTFHALGLQIHAESSGQKPSLSRLAEDERALLEALGDFVDSLIDDSAKHGAIVEFLSYFRYPLRSTRHFEASMKSSSMRRVMICGISAEPR